MDSKYKSNEAIPSIGKKVEGGGDIFMLQKGGNHNIGKQKFWYDFLNRGGPAMG